MTSHIFAEFDKAYRQLNEKQKEAVETIEGPVCVIAGPGTGKTQLLSVRIGHMMREGIDPSNILCMTYTEAGAYAMRKRLMQLVGPESNRLQISTFHGFCNGVIRENSEYFPQVRGADAEEKISQLEQKQLLLEICEKLPFDNLWSIKYENYGSKLKTLESFSAMVKKENWDVQELKNRIPEHIENEIRDNEEYKYKKKTGNKQVGDLKDNKVDELRKKFKRTSEACDVIAEYHKRMKDKGLYDYDDMILWVIRAFEEHPGLLGNYQEKFQYILVDEFQDTSGSQNHILRLLTRHWGKEANILVVGDDDQAIYGFQGAEPGNMDKFLEDFTPYCITLTDNYRSTQTILDQSARVIRYNVNRLEQRYSFIQKDLVARNAAPGDWKIYLTEFGNKNAEIAAVCNAIEDSIKKGTKPEEIAILYRNNKEALDVIPVLQKKNIPFRISRKENLMKLPLMHHVMTVLTWLFEEADQPGSGYSSFFNICHMPYSDIKATEAGWLAFHLREANKGRMNKDRITYRQLLMKASPTDHEFDLTLWARYKQLLRNMDDGLEAIRENTPQVAFQIICEKTGILQHIVNHPEKSLLVQQLAALFNHLKEYTAAHPGSTLKQWYDTLHDIMTLDTDDLVFTEDLGSEKGVELSTFHSAKGKEWDEVYLTGCTNNNFEKIRGKNGLALPEGFHAQGVHTSEEEIRRLFYVGMTRARRHLSLSFVEDPPEKKNSRNKPSIYVEQLQSGAEKGFFPAYQMPDNASQVDVLVAQLTRQPLVNPGLLDPDLIDRVLSEFQLSVTHLNKFLKCPLSFYYETILQIPGARSSIMGFGSVIHNVLHFWASKMKSGQVPDLASLEKCFREEMDDFHSHFTEIEMEKYTEHGIKILPDIMVMCGKLIEGGSEIKTEHKIDHVFWRDVPIKGVIDLMFTRDGEIVLADYKTGNGDHKKKIKPANEDNDGGDYWRQMVYYHILLTAQNPKSRVGEGYFVFLEKNVQETVHILQKDIDLVTSQMETAWAAIQRHEFEKGCGEEKCTWCSMVESHKLRAWPWTEEEEGEE